MQDSKTQECKLSTKHVTGFEKTQHPNNEAVGSTMYLVIGIHPDLSFVVHELAQFCESPKPVQWNDVKQERSYVNGTRDKRIHSSGLDKVDICGVGAPDWAGDTRDRRSTIEFLLMKVGGAIKWCFKIGSAVAISTCEG